jgi:enoyl-CoA hydratase
MDYYSAFPNMIFELRDPGILWITLSKPEKLNTADAGMHQALADLWSLIDADPAVRVVVVTGSGRAFSAGGDLDRIRNVHGNYEEVVAILEETRNIVYKMLYCSKPIIAAINGVAVGAGVVVGLLADISIMAEGARLGDGHTKMGWAAGDHAAIIWPLLCGMAKAKYYLMTSDFIDGKEAERIGLVSLCVPDDQLVDKAMQVATRLATGSRDAIKFTKRALNQWLLQAGPIFDHAMVLEMMGFFSPDLLAGLDGLKNKQPAKFPSREKKS